MNLNKKLLTKAYYQRKWGTLVERVAPSYAYWHKAKRFYFQRTGKHLDYRHPRDINEKMMWLTRYWQHPLKTKCADKYLVREYIAECGLQNLLIPLLGVWDKASDIDFDSLPQQFVLKCNHGSGFNIIVRDKATLDIEHTRRQLDQWLATDFDRIAQEIHYRDIPRKIICEKLVSTESPTEYQLRCINGEPINFLVCTKPNGNMNEYRESSFSLTWDRLPIQGDHLPYEIIPCPSCKDDLIAYARTLAVPFPLVRVDFYVVENRVYFAELTFTPSANVVSYKQEILNEWGNRLTLPKKYIPR